MDLFIEKPTISYEPTTASGTKIASVQLSEDPQSWSRSVLTELFRQVPATSEHTPQVMFMKVDEEQGFGLGVVVITNGSDSALSAIRPSAKTKKVLVPVVIKNHMLSPLDLIMTAPGGRMLPLTPTRLREALFRPETFEMVTDDWGDTSLYSLFYPPGRSDNSFGGGMSQSGHGGPHGASVITGPGMKFSSDAGYDLLNAIGPTLLETDIRRLGRHVESVSGLMKVSSSNDSFLNGLRVIASHEDVALKDVAPLMKVAFDTAPIDVIQMGYSHTHDAYWVKSASRQAFYHREVDFMPRGEFIKWAGEDVVAQVDTEGAVTASGGTAGLRSEDENWSIVSEPGIYKVRSTAGKVLTGWVLPYLTSPDGDESPLAVFTNGTSGQVQDEIVGQRVAEGVDLPAGTPKGSGVFYATGPDGKIRATTPLVVVGMEQDLDGSDSYHVRTLLGEDSKVKIVPGLKCFAAVGGEYMLPPGAGFLPLNDEMTVPLAATPSEAKKTASELGEAKITLYGGDSSGLGMRFYNMPKLASQFPATQDHETAVFALCLAGCDSKVAHSLVSHASSGETLDVHDVQDVVLAQDIADASRKVASEKSQQATSLRRYLAKEAAALPDVMSVDAVLSLGFINSENVRLFVSHIPYLEKALSQISTLVLASRLGLNEIPEYAAARASRAVDDVIQGLRALSIRDAGEGSGRRL